jgi:hypothetical protein
VLLSKKNKANLGMTKAASWVDVIRAIQAKGYVVPMPLTEVAEGLATQSDSPTNAVVQHLQTEIEELKAHLSDVLPPKPKAIRSWQI